MNTLRRRYGCPVELSLAFVGGKWRTVILAWLKEAPHRYAELRARMPGVSDKVLTQRLKELVAMGLVTGGRTAASRSARVYRLTARGRSLRPVLQALYDWGSAAAAELKIDVGTGRR
jgi:DNA-binding HxlR family transcriptional regulator